MHLRRALLLFAIVLGVAALATAISEPRDQRSSRPAPRPPARAEDPVARAQPPPRPPLSVRFDMGRRAQVRRVAPGRAVSLAVIVHAAGQVDVPALGLTAPAEPSTPARFDVLTDRPGRYAVLFTPAAAPARSVRIGTLAVVAGRHR